MSTPQDYEAMIDRTYDGVDGGYHSPPNSYGMLFTLEMAMR